MLTTHTQEQVVRLEIPRYYISNPREFRLLEVLLQYGATSRHDLDIWIGAENSPDLVMRMRRAYHFDLPMERRNFTDRDGHVRRIGYYTLSATDRPKAMAILSCTMRGEY